MDNLKFYQLTRDEIKSHKEEIISVIDAAFNCPGYGAQIIEEISQKENVVLSLVRDFNNAAIGVALAHSLPKETLAEYSGAQEDTFSKAIGHADINGTISVAKTIAILPAYQRKGIGTKLLINLNKYFKSNGATVSIVPAWKAGERINIGVMMDKQRYIHFNEHKGIWREDCEGNQFTCPEHIPNKSCVCSAVYYYKPL